MNVSLEGLRSWVCGYDLFLIPGDTEDGREGRAYLDDLGIAA
jgi:hypothetical protein